MSPPLEMNFAFNYQSSIGSFSSNMLTIHSVWRGHLYFGVAHSSGLPIAGGQSVGDWVLFSDASVRLVSRKSIHYETAHSNRIDPTLHEGDSGASSARDVGKGIGFPCALRIVTNSQKTAHAHHMEGFRPRFRLARDATLIRQDRHRPYRLSPGRYEVHLARSQCILPTPRAWIPKGVSILGLR